MKVPPQVTNKVCEDRAFETVTISHAWADNIEVLFEGTDKICGYLTIVIAKVSHT